MSNVINTHCEPDTLDTPQPTLCVDCAKYGWVPEEVGNLLGVLNKVGLNPDDVSEFFSIVEGFRDILKKKYAEGIHNLLNKAEECVDDTVEFDDVVKMIRMAQERRLEIDMLSPLELITHINAELLSS